MPWIVCSTAEWKSEPSSASMRAESPPQQPLYRGWVSFSKPMTDTPARLNSYAAVAPAGPMPTTITSHRFDGEFIPKETQSQTGGSKRSSNKAAGEVQAAGVPGGYVEDLNEPRTKLGIVFTRLNFYCPTYQPIPYRS